MSLCWFLSRGHAVVAESISHRSSCPHTRQNWQCVSIACSGLTHSSLTRHSICLDVYTKMFRTSHGGPLWLLCVPALLSWPYPSPEVVTYRASADKPMAEPGFQNERQRRHHILNSLPSFLSLTPPLSTSHSFFLHFRLVFVLRGSLRVPISVDRSYSVSTFIFIPSIFYITCASVSDL